jgi:hypothetical protein
LERGDIDKRLQEHAARLDEYAAYLRSLIGRIKAPSFAEWKAAEAAQDASWEAFRKDHESKAQWIPDDVELDIPF